MEGMLNAMLRVSEKGKGLAELSNEKLKSKGVQTIKIDASNIKCDVPYLQQGKEGLG
jgi:hypothetical protein